MGSRKELATKITPLGVIAPTPLHIATPAFEGSLAMLFYAVRESKVDLREIPLGPVCEAYFEYLLGSDSPDIDEAAVALVALAYLIERKAWGLLPTPEPEPELEEPMEALPPTIGEYAHAVEALRVYHLERERLFFRSGDVSGYEIPVELGNVGAGDLARALARLIERAKPDPNAQVSAKARRSLSDQMKATLAALTPQWTALERLIGDDYTIEDAVYWFLSLLELIRLGQADIRIEEDQVEFRGRQ